MTTGLALTVALLGGASSVASAQDEVPVTLRLAVADDMNRPTYPVVQAFAAAAAELSGGSVTIEPMFEAGGDDFEVGTARLLLDGGAELAIAAGRSWDQVGVDSFRALQAPFLIDNDALAEAVADSGAARVMLDSLDAHGLVGLELWPEDLRHPATYPGCAEPLVRPEDFAGLGVRAIPSGVSYDLLETIGARPSFGEWDETCPLQATESGLRQGASLPSGVTFTGDVAFFPKFQVLAADAKVFDRLSESQRQAIRGAAAAAQDLAIETHPTEAEAAEAWCADGGRVVLAGPENVVAFQAAAQPVLDRLAQDPVAAEAIAAIRTLKETVEPAPGAIACGVEPADMAPVAVASEASAIDGTYITHVSLEELASSPLLYDRGEANDGNWGDMTFTFDAGMFVYTGENPKAEWAESGSYALDGDVLTLYFTDRSPDEDFTLGWSLEGDTLTLERIPDMEGPTPFIIKPWTRLADETGSVDTAATLLLGKYHVPDTTGYSGDLPPDGTYRYTASAADLEAAGATPTYAATEWGVGTWTLADGTFVLDLETPAGMHQCSGTVTSLGGTAVRIDTTSPMGPRGCLVDFDLVWRMDGDTFWYTLVGAEDLAGWTVEDWDNEQAWSQIPNLRIE